MNADGHVIRIEFWSVCATSNDWFLPPEANPLRLYGQLYGHPEIANGAHVRTGRLVRAQGKTVTVEDVDEAGRRSRYEVVLGTIEPDYLDWLKENWPAWDPNAPVVIH